MDSRSDAQGRRDCYSGRESDPSECQAEIASEQDEAALDELANRLATPGMGYFEAAVEVTPDVLEALDAFIAAHPDPKPTRSEAAKRLIELGAADMEEDEEG